MQNYPFKEFIHSKKSQNYSFKESIHSKKSKIIHSKKIFIQVKNVLSPRAKSGSKFDKIINIMNLLHRARWQTYLGPQRPQETIIGGQIYEGFDWTSLKEVCFNL